mmetsp:Transcript_6806/g.16954  ORF Transcript_6806/g.16954 Transcript_6806/m.16954 type:complete len:99 (-) Transcript_6806:116-412(-)
MQPQGQDAHGDSGLPQRAWRAADASDAQPAGTRSSQLLEEKHRAPSQRPPATPGGLTASTATPGSNTDASDNESPRRHQEPSWETIGRLFHISEVVDS